MSEFKGTKGEWSVEINKTDDTNYVCEINPINFQCYVDSEETEFNAQLIVYAPEILEGLRKCVEHLRIINKNHWDLERIDELIKKAIS